MKQKTNWLISIAAIMCLGFALAGCAFLEEQQALSTEQMLSAAGFIMKVADTPKKLAHLQTLTQRKVVAHQRNGKNYYVYANAYQKCMYVGDEKAYQKYQNLKFQKQIADENRDAAAENRAAAETSQMAAMENENAAMNWGMWGPYPYGW